jgi:hypothetical protein
MADNEMDLELYNYIADTDSPVQWDVCTIQNIPPLIHPTLKSQKQAEMVSLMAIAAESRRNKGNKKR